MKAVFNPEYFPLVGQGSAFLALVSQQMWVNVTG